MKAKTKKVNTFVKPTLNVSELRYRRLFEAAQDGILIPSCQTSVERIIQHADDALYEAK